MQIVNWKQMDFDQGMKITTMLENESVKEISITLPKDSVLREHKAPSKISVQVLSGKIEFGVQDQVWVMEALDQICLDEGVLHHLKGLEDSVIRLSLYECK